MLGFNIYLLNKEEKFALLFGIMLGDGCLSCYHPKDRKEKKVIVITGNIHDDRDFFEFVVVPLLKSLTQNSVKIKNKAYCGTIEIHISDKELFNKINLFSFPIGKKGTSLFIPKIFYEKNLVKYVVQGFFATDGSLVLTKNGNKFYSRVEGNGISKELIKQIVEYLVKVSMHGYFYEAKRKKIDLRWGPRQQPYRFQFNGKENLILFKNLVGFANPKHKRRHRKFLRYSEAYDNKIKGLPSKKQKAAGEEINIVFYK